MAPVVATRANQGPNLLSLSHTNEELRCLPIGSRFSKLLRHPGVGTSPNFALLVVVRELVSCISEWCACRHEYQVEVNPRESAQLPRVDSSLPFP